jgi:hypothetical protein
MQFRKYLLAIRACLKINKKEFVCGKVGKKAVV